jgi:hypothetical protein
MAALWTILLRDPTVAIVLITLFIIALAITFFRNNRELQRLQKSMMLNMAILVYLENQNVFLPRGIRAQIGYMGNWIELIKERQPDSKSKTIPKRIGGFAGDATFKRNL